MSEISREDVLQIASLAKLHLSEEEIDSMRIQLARILDHFRAIEKVDTSSVPPMKHILGNQNVFRADDVRESIPQDAALKNAPEARDGFFVVPKVLDNT